MLIWKMNANVLSFCGFLRYHDVKKSQTAICLCDYGKTGGTVEG